MESSTMESTTMESSTMEYVSIGEFINEFFEQEGLTLVTPPSTPEHHTYNTEMPETPRKKRKMNEQDILNEPIFPKSQLFINNSEFDKLESELSDPVTL